MKMKGVVLVERKAERFRSSYFTTPFFLSSVTEHPIAPSLSSEESEIISVYLEMDGP